MKLQVKQFSPNLREDFFGFHSRVEGECFCTAWWVPTWEEWEETTPESNRQLRDKLLEKGEYDGYLIFADDQVAGWCQVGKRDRLGKVLSQFDMSPDPQSWAITCFRIDPEYQRKGLATHLLQAVLKHLRKKGVKRVEAFAKIDISLPGDQQWTGPRSIYEKTGFSKVRDNNTRAIYEIEL